MIQEISHSKSHPKTGEEVFWEVYDLLGEADKILHSKNPNERAQKLEHMQSELEQMTPMERMHLARSLAEQQRSDEKQPIEKRIKGLGSVPRTKIDVDGNGDLQSISFRSVSDDSAFGSKIDVRLDHRRTDEGANTEEVKLPDGSKRVLHYDSDSTNRQLCAIEDQNGKFKERNKDGSWTLYDGCRQLSVQDLSLAQDGTVSYTVIDADAKARFQERYDTNGDDIKEGDYTGKLGTLHSKIRTHVEYPKEAQSVTTRVREIDGHGTWQSVSTIDNDGRETLVTDTAIVKRGGADNNVTIEPLVGGKPSGKLEYTTGFSAKGEIIGGKVVVTYPDGSMKKLDADAEEMERVLHSDFVGAEWKTVDGDPHHLYVSW